MKRVNFKPNRMRNGASSEGRACSQSGRTLGRAAIEHPLSTHSAPFGTTRKEGGYLYPSPMRTLIRIAAMITLLFTIGVGQMGAADASSARIYFDNTKTGWSYVQLVGGHSSWSSGTALSKISNTNNLWTTTWTWGGYTYFMFIDASGSWPGEGKEAWNRKGDLNYSATISDNVGSNTYLYAPTSSSKNTGYDPSGKLSSSYSDLNYTQTINQKLTTDGGSSYSLSTAALASTVRVSSYYLSAAATASSTGNKDISSGNSSNSCKAARTATVTYTISGVTTGYHFVGWYDGDTEKSTDATYTYQATGAKTITARFTKNYTVGSVLYLKPNSDWKSDNARFAAYFIGTGDATTWVDCSRVGESDYWSVTVPSGNWGYVIFCRMDGSKAANNWDNKWNQTDDLMYDASHNGVEITGWDNSQNRIAVATATITGTYHYFPGETISLTVTPMGDDGAAKTYQWYKGGTASGNAISGATSATYTKASCTYDDMGAYYCKVTWGGNAHWADDGTAYNLKMLRLWVNGSKGGEAYGNVDFTKVDGTTAEATINLGLLWTYGFSISDGCGTYYGNTGTMTATNCTNWSMSGGIEQCGLTTTNAADYTFTVNYSNLGAPVVSVAYPVSDQAASKTIYFDNQTVTWSNVYYRIGRTNHSQATAMTKVSGTANLYKVTTTEYDNFSSWFIANAQGGTGDSKSIYNTKNTPAITAATQYIGNAVTASSVTVTPGADHSTGGTDENNNCEFYSKTITSGMKTDAVTISPYTNGTITVNYVNTSDVASNFTSGTENLAHSVILTSITAVANTGYDASAITINGGAYSANYVVTGATTIAASFTPHVYSITYLDQGGAAFSGTHESGYPTTHTYNTATTLKSASKTGYEFGGWYTNSACTGDAVTSLGATAYTADITLYAKWTPVRLYFVTAGNWNNENNWSPKCVPTIEHDVTIQAPCSVDIEHAKAKSIIIDQNGKTGRLTIGANKGLEVTGTIARTTDGSNSLATRAEDLVLESAAAGNASLIFNNSNGCQATVYMYSKAVGSGSTWNWQYVGTPFADTKASPNYNGSYLYHWNSASSTWEPVSNNDDIDPFTGYCITQSSATVLEMTGTLNSSSNQSITIPANSSCVVANSWTGPIYIRQLRDADFGSMEKTIYLFNTGNDKDKNHGEGTSAGTYRAVPIHAASYLGDSVISSMQGFFVKNSTESSQTLQLKYANHVRPARATDAILNGAMYAPKRIQTAEPEVMKVIVQSNKGGATLYLLAREDFTRGYEDGWDGENINEAGAAPLLYSPRADGTKDAVSAIPDFEGAIVGFITGEEDEYMFSFSYNGTGKWYLNDLKNQTSTRIKAKNTYTFHPTGNDMKRFVISATPLAMVAASDPVVSVLVDGYPETEFDDFDDAWTVAMNAPAATVKLLADIERTETIVYRPTVDNARHTLDLNNHTLTGNSSNRLLQVSKEDARLMLTDLSGLQGGCLYLKQSCDTNLNAVVVDKGTLEVAGGKVYCENTLGSDNRHPTACIRNQRSDEAQVIISGGRIEAVASSYAYAVVAYGPVTIAGGTLRGTVTTYTNARALSQNAGTATITGGTLEAIATGTGSYAYTIVAAFYAASKKMYNGVVNIEDGIFFASGEAGSLGTVRAEADVQQAGDEILKGFGTINISGGNFTSRCTAPEGKQVFAGVVNGERLFDNATPHHLLAESQGEMNISGGTFLVDMRDGDAYYGAGDVVLFRSWGKLNITGGHFSLFTHKDGSAIGIFRNKASISGNPVFEIHSESGARGLVAGPWNSSKYCDADASNNWAEVEVSGGTFTIESITEEGNAIGVWAEGGLSTGSSSAEKGYAMNAKITVTGGEFTTIHPNGKGSRAIRQDKTQTGEYGTAVAQVIIRDGKFKAVAGTPYSPAGTSNIDDQEELTELSGGYFPTFNQLALHTSYDCTLRELTSDEPEYAEGFRYQVVPTSEKVAKVKVNGEEQEFAMLQGAIRFARRQNSEAVVTILEDVPFYGPHKLVPTVDDNDITLDLNGFTVSAVTTADRFLTIDKAGMRFSLTDRSAEQSGIWQMNATVDATAYGLLCNKGELRITGGMIMLPPSGNKETVAFGTLTEDALLTISGGQITAQSALLSKGGAITVSGGLFNTPTNISGTPAGTITLTGGYYVSDEQLADYCEFPYAVLPTTDADKERVGEIYAYKISDESSERGIRLDIVDYTPTSMTLNMNGFRSDEEPPYGWEVEAFGAIYRSEDCAANKTLTVALSEPVEPDDTVRICVRSQAGTIESARFYQIPYIFESDATLPEGDYSSSVLYVRSGTLTIDREVQASKVIICPEAELDVTDGLLTADTVVLRSLPTRSAVIYGSFTTDKLYFTRIGPDGSESYPATKYHPFALPIGYSSPVEEVRLSNGTTPAYGTSWVLRRNVGETEVKLTIDDIVESGKEYELFSSLPYYREYYFPLSPMATGIENALDGGAKARKLLIDGEIRILINGQLYNLMGKRVQ